jgi:hypothetical protein
MKVEKVLTFVTDDNPGKCMIVLRSHDGWYWIKNLVLAEGFQTPFSSIEEIGVYLNVKNPLVLHSEMDMPTIPQTGKP